MCSHPRFTLHTPTHPPTLWSVTQQWSRFHAELCLSLFLLTHTHALQRDVHTHTHTHTHQTLYISLNRVRRTKDWLDDYDGLAKKKLCTIFLLLTKSQIPLNYAKLNYSNLSCKSNVVVIKHEFIDVILCRFKEPI